MRRPSPRLLTILAAGLALLFGSAPAVAGPLLYGAAVVDPDNNPVSDLYTIDSATGNASLVGSIGFQGVNAIDFGPGGVLYGIGRLAPTVDDDYGDLVLISIDPSTGVGTEIASLGLDDTSEDITDMTFLADGTLYAYRNPFTIMQITYGPGTASTTDLWENPDLVFGNSLAANGAQIISTANDSYIGQPDLPAGTGYLSPTVALDFSDLAPFTTADFPQPVAMDFDLATGVLWAVITNGFNSPAETYLGTIDPATGKVLIVGPTLDGLTALAVRPVPEPAALALVALGLGVLGVAARRRLAA